MMTKLLFGISDEYRTSDVYRYTNTTENAIVMTVGGNEITINAGEHYDAPQAVNAPDGLSLQILGPTRCNVALLSNMNDLNTLEEVDIRNCYNDSEEYHLGDFKINNLASLHVYRAIGSSITTFKPAEGVILNEVKVKKETKTKKQRQEEFSKFKLKVKEKICETIEKIKKKIQDTDQKLLEEAKQEKRPTVKQIDSRIVEEEKANKKDEKEKTAKQENKDSEKWKNIKIV